MYIISMCMVMCVYMFLCIQTHYYLLNILDLPYMLNLLYINMAACLKLICSLITDQLFYNIYPIKDFPPHKCPISFHRKKINLYFLPPPLNPTGHI